jgi:hypothetical protein
VHGHEQAHAALDAVQGLQQAVELAQRLERVLPGPRAAVARHARARLAERRAHALLQRAQLQVLRDRGRHRACRPQRRSA